MSTKKNIPFLKWAGGKRWLMESHSSLFDFSYERFIEPFLGGGAVFFGLQPRRAILSDSNDELINVYSVIKHDWELLVSKLKKHHKKHDFDYYYKLRSSKPRSDVGRAARFIYLNRTCWNGLYRVNRKGEFNVPIGTKSSVFQEEDDFEFISKLLRNVTLQSCDFEKTISMAKKGDFLFVDPPYTVLHNKNGFVKYNESIFTWSDQCRLKDAVEAACSQGAKVMVTNASHASIVDLYSGVGEITTLKRKSTISGSVASRGKYEEVVIKCF
ncbi:Dam family site-specific DNA-(adenine-N6)-methyltransferase [Microbulbifer sp. CAU 1566]|uniref:DNA adenine methylase n=1 Tax=Microbulbifer sp. CAU 1566 TaxID=2933269 RepID=UPI00200510B3|nr:Dam family site-specific DNA-(adenine-N6)-methyltransferase [Microbulbifer sp. CAU 1566]